MDFALHTTVRPTQYETQTLDQTDTSNPIAERLNNTDVINLADENLFQQLTQEWEKILAAAGFYKNFSYWIFQHPELHPMPEGLPSATYLYTMEQLLKHQTDVFFPCTARQSKTPC